MTAILLLLLQISCSLLTPQMGYAAETIETAVANAANHAPAQDAMPLDQFPGEDQESESSLNLEESEDYADDVAHPTFVQPIYFDSASKHTAAIQQTFYTCFADVMAPPPKA